MCDCYQTVKQKLAEHFQAKLPEGAVDFELELQGVCIWAHRRRRDSSSG